MEAPSTIELPDGRTLSYDDVGDRAGLPTVYLHGTPDSRLARHPDDAVAASLGIRLLAVDRPGTGDSDPNPGGGLTSLGHDLAALLDHLEIDAACLLGWSSGGLAALAAATILGDRTLGVALVATVPPVEAYTDDAVRLALGPARRAFVEMASEVPRHELAAEVAPYLVPLPLTAATALEHVLEGAGERGGAELAAVPGAAEALARGLAGSVAGGLAGLTADLARQLEPGLDLGLVRARVRTFHGSHDPISPPEVGAWLVARLADAALDVSPGAGHHLLFPRWAGILRALRRDVGR